MDQDLQTRACARAIVDRLTYGGNIIEIGTHSYRLAQTRSRREAQQAQGGAKSDRHSQDGRGVGLKVDVESLVEEVSPKIIFTVRDST